jgi:hypothetical protein
MITIELAVNLDFSPEHLEDPNWKLILQRSILDSVAKNMGLRYTYSMMERDEEMITKNLCPIKVQVLLFVPLDAKLTTHEMVAQK